MISLQRVLFDLISILQALLPRKTCNEIVSTKAQLISSREELGKQFKIKEGRGHLHKRSMKSIAEEAGKVKMCCEFKSKQKPTQHTCFDVISPGLLQTSTGHNFRWLHKSKERFSLPTSQFAQGRSSDLVQQSNS